MFDFCSVSTLLAISNCKGSAKFRISEIKEKIFFFYEREEFIQTEDNAK